MLSPGRAGLDPINSACRVVEPGSGTVPASAGTMLPRDTTAAARARHDEHSGGHVAAAQLQLEPALQRLDVVQASLGVDADPGVVGQQDVPRAKVTVPTDRCLRPPTPA
jgi:hypothetical protein